LLAIKIAALSENSPCDFETKTGYATNILAAVSLLTPYKKMLHSKKLGQYHKSDIPDGKLCDFFIILQS